MIYNSQEKISKLTGKEFFKPKGARDLQVVFQELADRASSKKVVLVGGTNGKGETCFSLEWCAKKAGLKPAMFTSPHLFSIHERFRFDGKNIDEIELRNLLKAFDEKYPNNKCDLSYFELCFWLFLSFVEIKSPDLIICEVGLGGRLDITNLLEPSVAIVTNISRDHTELLGNTYKKILFEKLGITREGVPLFTGLSTDYLKNEVKVFAEKKGFSVCFIEPHKHYSHSNKLMAKKVFETVFNKSSRNIPFDSLFEEKVDPRIKDFNHCEDRKIVFFGAHNLDGHRSLIKSLGARRGFSFIFLSFSNRKISEIKSILKCYLDWTDLKIPIYLNGLPFFKSCDLVKLESALVELGVTYLKILKCKIELKKILKNQKTCLWTGSYYSCELFDELF